MGAPFQTFSLPSLPLSAVNSVLQVPVSPSVRAVMPQFQGFASHWTSLHLGAGSQ